MSDPSARLTRAFQPSRPLLGYTLAATLPLMLMAAALLSRNPMIWYVGILGTTVNLIAFGYLLYEITMELAGFPEYAMPVWIVLYLVIYLISGFTFVYFTMHLTSPGYYFSGFAKSSDIAFLDAFYVSASSYIGMNSLDLKVQTSRLIGVCNGILSMFLNVVIITKFVNTF